MELRYYQREAINAVYWYLRQNGTKNPICVVPTGGGKTPIMSAMCRDVAKAGGRVLVLSHVKELIQQTAATLLKVDPTLDVGVYSAGLNSRDTGNAIICAGIQSVYKNVSKLGSFKLILVDECHLIPPDGDGMYQTCLQEARSVNPSVRLVGMTATPYRMKSGMLTGDGKLFDDICYEISVKELIDRGFLSNLRTKTSTAYRIDTSKLHTTAGEFTYSEVEELYDDSVLSNAIGEIRAKAEDRKKILVFLPTTATAERFAQLWKARTGETVGLVFGSTPAEERAELVARFKGETVRENLFGDEKPPLRILANVSVLTTGFDAPNVDCVVLLRPTKSPGLYYQMVGRGFRTAPEKKDCLVLDFGNNVARHGPINAITPPADRKNENAQKRPKVKQCKACGELVPLNVEVCPDCGHVFPKRNGNEQYGGAAGEDEILAEEKFKDTTLAVKNTKYFVHIKKDGDETTPHTLRVEYQTVEGVFREWVCPEHDGWARTKFENWWCAHTHPMMQPPYCRYPDNADEAAAWAKAMLAPTKSITIRKHHGKRFPEIHSCEIGEAPTPEQVEEAWKAIEEAMRLVEEF